MAVKTARWRFNFDTYRNFQRHRIALFSLR